MRSEPTIEDHIRVVTDAGYVVASQEAVDWTMAETVKQARAQGRAAGLREAAELVAEIKADPYYPLPKSDRDTLLRVIGWEDACDQIANAVRELADEGER